MPGVYFHKLLDFFPTSTAMSLDSHSWCLELIFINSWTFSQRLLLCPLTVTVDAWSWFSLTPGLFPNVYCYVPWQSQLMPGVYFHKLLDFFPTSTAMSLDSHSWCLEFIFINSWTFSQRLLLCPMTVTVDAWSLFSSTPGLFPNVYSCVPWQSQLMPGVYFHKLLDFFPTSTAMSLDSHSWCLEFIFINSWTFSQRLLLCPLTVTVDAWSLSS